MEVLINNQPPFSQSLCFRTTCDEFLRLNSLDIYIIQIKYESEQNVRAFRRKTVFFKVQEKSQVFSFRYGRNG